MKRVANTLADDSLPPRKRYRSSVLVYNMRVCSSEKRKYNQIGNFKPRRYTFWIAIVIRAFWKIDVRRFVVWSSARYVSGSV